jgi:outer membrane protein assembly factor BamB
MKCQKLLENSSATKCRTTIFTARCWRLYGEIERMIRRTAIIAITALALGPGLGACAILDVFDEKIPDPLPGERTSILLDNRTIAADPALADKQILLPVPTPNQSWPQAGGYPNHAMQHIQIHDSLAEVWSIDIGSGSDDSELLNGTPVVADGKVFSLDANSLVSAHEVANGKRIWQADLTPEFDDDGHISGGIAYDSGMVYVATGFNDIIALDAGNGKEKWRRRVETPMRAAPTIRGNRLFQVTLGNQLYALDSKTGETLWTHRGLPEVASVLGGASPAVDKGVVVVPYTSGELVALKVETGRELWQDSLVTARRADVASSISGIRGRPVIDRGRVIAISNGGVMVAIDLRTGDRLWQKNITGIESPWVVGNYIYALSTDSELICLSRDDGRVYWVRGLPRFEDPENLEDPITWTGPILASDRLIVAGSNGKALAISPYDGNFLGSVDMPDGVAISPVVAQGSVFFLANDAELIVYR